MAGYGTAPRKVKGIWYTSAGRRLNPAGQRYWEAKSRSGQFDTLGHRIQHPEVTLASPKAKKPLPSNWLTGDQDARQKRQQAIYQKSRQATKQQQAGVNQAIRARFAGVEETAARANKTINPVVGSTLEALSPLTATMETLKALQHHEILKAGLAASAIIPFGPGRGLGAGEDIIRGVKAAKAAEALTPEERVLGATGAAKIAYGQQKKLRSAERGKRAAQLQAAFDEAGGGEAGHIAKLGQLKGELPRVRFDKLTDIDQPTMDYLLGAVDASPHLQELEKVALGEGLRRARQGYVPPPHVIALVERAFGQEKAQELAAMSLGRKVMRGAAEVANVPRSVMASADVSAPFRQALVAGAHNPRIFAKNLGPMFKYLVSEKRYAQTMREIEEHPMYHQMVESGVKFTDLGDISKREEAFASNLAEKITGGKYSFVRASGRAYVGFLNKMRADIYADLATTAQDLGIATPKLHKDLADFVNWATGRGGLGPLEKAAVPLNAVLFSPRLFASRVQAFNPAFYYRLDPFVRKQAVGSMVKLLGAGSTVLALAGLAGAKVGMNPNSADFGKIKIGNTRLDVWGGHQQLARLFSQIRSGEITSSTTGETLRLGGAHKLSRHDITWRFIEGKYSPSASLVNDWFKGTDFADRPFSWKREVVQRSYPLLVQDVLDTYRDTGSIPKAVGAYGIGAFGVGVQTYGPKKKPGLIEGKLGRAFKQKSIEDQLDEAFQRASSGG